MITDGPVITTGSQPCRLLYSMNYCAIGSWHVSPLDHPPRADSGTGVETALIHSTNLLLWKQTCQIGIKQRDSTPVHTSQGGAILDQPR